MLKAHSDLVSSGSSLVSSSQVPKAKLTNKPTYNELNAAFGSEV